MEPSILPSRFILPINIVRPKGSARFEFWAPKLKRRVTLFNPQHVKLCTYLESNPRVSAYCERPTYWRSGEDKQLIDFWIKAGHRELCWIATSDLLLGRAGALSQTENIDVHYVQPQSLASHEVWIENWMRILPYLSSNACFVSNQLLADIEQAALTAPTLGEIERNFQPNDIMLVRTAVFMLLHQGRLRADALRVQALGPGINFRRLP
ncbi:hypothetical protein [Undibacterium umbellatum]|uniref:TnsA endonuclease N-terminal domain-containing protein n=1 Tax=Undibacterium umbellatum TaxID=2762300 RepID=A0ABR6ZIH9_9BURK|nr:hypothetical protein [Undibacterium umbellatum]MBC3911525.1 hypothetical protein [Undibacterium umbellatum]